MIVAGNQRYPPTTGSARFTAMLTDSSRYDLRCVSRHGSRVKTPWTDTPGLPRARTTLPCRATRPRHEHRQQTDVNRPYAADNDAVPTGHDCLRNDRRTLAAVTVSGGHAISTEGTAVKNLTVIKKSIRAGIEVHSPLKRDNSPHNATIERFSSIKRSGRVGFANRPANRNNICDSGGRGL